MPGLSGRMSTVVKSKISKLLDKAEDPSETLEYSYQKQMELLQNVKKGIADVVTSKKRLQLQEQKLQQQVVKLDTQARQALAGGNEELARTALERKNVAQTELQSLDAQIVELESQQEQLTASEQKLRAKIEQFRSKKEVIKAQYSAAEAQVKIGEAATGVGEEMADVGLAMQRALDKTENMRSRASAMQELEAAGTFDDLTSLTPGEDDIDRQLRQLSSGSQVDDDLSKMKAELGSAAGRHGRARSRFGALGGPGELGRRQRAKPDPAGFRSGTARAGSRPGYAVIVRIATEGQYEVADADVAALNELDNAAVTACEAGDGSGFADVYGSWWRSCAQTGARSAMTICLAPTSSCRRLTCRCEEARVAFQGEGLIPG